MRTAALFLLTLAVGAAPHENLFPEPILRGGRQIVTELYSLRYLEAEESARRLAATYPREPLAHAFLARSYWSRQLGEERAMSLERFSRSDFFSESRALNVSVDGRFEADFRAASRRAIETAQARLKEDPNDYAARYALGYAYQHLAAFEFSVKKKWWASYRLGEKMFEQQRVLLSAVPDFADPHLSNGISMYLADALPASVKLFAILFGFRGNREQGKQELELVARDGIFLSEDARTILALLYARDKQYDQAILKLREMLTRYPSNSLAHLEIGGVLLAQKKIPEATAIYQQVLAKVEAGAEGYSRMEPPTVYNRLGVTARIGGDYKTARSWFEKTIAFGREGRAATTIARLELGKTFDLMGEREKAQEQYRPVLTAADIGGTQREAQGLMRKPYKEVSK